MKKYILFVLVFVVFLVSACVPALNSEKTLTVMTHDSFTVSQEIVQDFESQNGVKLVFLKSGDTGAALNRAILTRKSPQADVFFGVDNTYLSRALDSGIFEKYQSPFLSQVPEEFSINLDGQVTPIDYGDVCINFNRAFFELHQLSIPTSLDDLLKPELGRLEGQEALLVVENPATSSPGLAFLLATIAEFGEEGYLDFWRSLKQNGVVVVNDWETAYYTNFSASSGKGLQPMVVSYATSPAAEVIYASEPVSEPPTASIVGDNTCFRQIEYVGILKGTRNKELARKYIDFMISLEFQEDIPLQMFMYPVREDARIPEEFIEYAQLSANPAMLDPNLIMKNREKWIQDWSEVMLP